MSGSNWIKTVPSTVSQLVGFILVAKVFRKAFRILGLDERKGRWVVEQDFHRNFQVKITWFFAFFSSVLDWIVPILVWFERSLHSAQVGRQSCPWLLKLMTSKLVESTWTSTGSYGLIIVLLIQGCHKDFKLLGKYNKIVGRESNS